MTKETLSPQMRPQWHSLKSGDTFPVRPALDISDEQVTRISTAYADFDDSKIWGRREYMTGLRDVLKEGKYDSVRVYEFDDGSESFAFFARVRRVGGSHDEESQVFFVDIVGDKIIGEGLVRFSTEGNPNFEQRGRAGVPYVAWTHTCPGFEGQGLNERRLELMNNALSDDRLSSGQQFQHTAAERTWLSLVANGRARKDGVLPSGANMYRFVV